MACKFRQEEELKKEIEEKLREVEDLRPILKCPVLPSKSTIRVILWRIAGALAYICFTYFVWRFGS